MINLWKHVDLQKPALLWQTCSRESLKLLYHTFIHNTCTPKALNHYFQILSALSCRVDLPGAQPVLTGITAGLVCSPLNWIQACKKTWKGYSGEVIWNETGGAGALPNRCYGAAVLTEGCRRGKRRVFVCTRVFLQLLYYLTHLGTSPDLLFPA